MNNQINKQGGLGNGDILAILRAADDIIDAGGRTLLSLILKGSRDRRLLSHGLENNPSYGYYSDLKVEHIVEKIDWMIHHDFLKIEMSHKLPLIVFTERGWIIERAQRANEFLLEWERWIAQGKIDVDMAYLKDRNREMILMFLERVKETGDSKFIPYLRQWARIDYKKVQAAIQETIDSLELGLTRQLGEIHNTFNDVLTALQATPLEPERLKCWDCGERFMYEVEEQKYFQLKGYEPPKRCPVCRERKSLIRMGIDPDLL